MKFWKTYVTLAALAGLGSYLYFIEARKPDPNAKAKAFASVEKAKVKEITISRPRTDPIRVVKDGENWKLAGTTESPADSGMVGILLGAIEDAEVGEVASDDPPSLAEYGLDNPSLTIGVVTEEGGEPRQLQFGNKTPDEASVFAKIATAKRVFTIPTYVQSSFDKKAFDLRDRNVLHMKRDTVNKVDIKGPTDTLSLVKDEKGDWTFTKPMQTKAGKWLVDGLLVSMENLLFDDLAAEDATAAELKPFGLDSPKWVAVMQLADGTAKKLEIGKTTPDDKNKHYARDGSRNMVGVISQTVPDELAKAKDHLRSKYLLDFPAYEVTEFTVTADGQSRTFVRAVTKNPTGGADTHTWNQTVPTQKTVETKKLQDLLFDVATSDVKAFIDDPGPLSSYGLDKPLVRVELKFENKAPGWFEIGTKGGTHYGRRDNDVAVMKLLEKASASAAKFKEL